MSTAVTRCPVGPMTSEARVPDRPSQADGSGDGAQALLAKEFETLYACVHRYLLHRFFDRELAEELTARTFYKAAAHVSGPWGEIRDVRVWLLRVATNLAQGIGDATWWPDVADCTRTLQPPQSADPIRSRGVDNRPRRLDDLLAKPQRHRHAPDRHRELRILNCRDRSGGLK